MEKRTPPKAAPQQSARRGLILAPMKPVKFVATSKRDLREMPKPVRATLGEELQTVQFGGMPSDFKPMPSIGAGVYEIRCKDMFGAFRVVYVAKFDEAVYVLHAFQKKTQKTSPKDIALAASRYRNLLEQRREANLSER